MRLGIQAAFNLINSKGGYRGRNFDLITYDDGYEPAPAAANAVELINRDEVFALIGAVGTPTSQVILPVALQNNVPFIGAFTGARFLRDPWNRYIVNVRASYIDETAAMVNYLTNVKRIFHMSIFYQDDSF